ncbi:MAG TPA: flagellar motor protein MotB, partial [Clostridiaceae bacterium]|nr:flagellar motor protein MotB [Clostridiaceae bacterium]
DNRPINNKQFKSNWELSTSRAVNVLKRLLEISKLGPEKFSAVGYGEFHPIANNNTATGRTQNRRVDFIIEKK